MIGRVIKSGRIGFFIALAIVIVSAFIYTPARAQDIAPVETEIIAPVAFKDGSGLPPVAAAPVSPEWIVTKRFMTPAGEARFRLIKEKASKDADVDSSKMLPTAEPQAGPQPLASVAISFPGLDYGDSGFFPPDTVVAKSFNHVLEAVNGSLRLFDNAGKILDTRDLDQFFGANNNNGVLFDPKVYFDRNGVNKRFYVVALQQNDFPRFSRIWLAISRSQDPSRLDPGDWCVYPINGRRNKDKPKDSWADYPGLGAGKDAILISDNQFRFSDGSFTYAVVKAIDKIAATDNAAACPGPTIHTFITAGDPDAFTLQPVQHFTGPSSFPGTTNPAYLISTVFGTSNIYRVWQVRNVASGSPSWRNVSVTGSFTYGVQPNAPQPGSSATCPSTTGVTCLDTGDNRMTQAAGVGNAVSGVHATRCNIGGGSAESCVRYVRIIPGQDGAGNLLATLNRQRNISGNAGDFFFWPGVAVNTSNQTMVDFQRSSAGSFLSAWWTTKDLAATNFDPPSSLIDGDCSQILADRTGDYVGAQTDPSDNTSFWIAGERATTIGGGCAWETGIMKVTP